MTEQIYAIGDIHGQAAMLDLALERIRADGGADAPIVFLGDYTDRGPDSKGVLDRLIAGRDAGKPWVFLKGNHDRMFEWFLESPPRADPYLFTDLYWLHERLGGDTTLASYGVDMSKRRRLFDLHAEVLEKVPPPHVAFLQNGVLSHETEALFFAHAGIRPEIALTHQAEEDLLWIRQEFHAFPHPHPKLIVHGHTPVDAATHYGNRINLDSGAGYGHPLTTVVFEGEECWVLGPNGRSKLSPVGSGL